MLDIAPEAALVFISFPLLLMNLMNRLKLLNCYDGEASKSIFELQEEGWEKLTNLLTVPTNSSWVCLYRTSCRSLRFGLVHIQTKHVSRA